jgi:hypothetical protein
MESISRRNELFRSDAQEDAEKILASEGVRNEYVGHLKTLLSSLDSKEARQAIGDYGISKISENENPALASYFFVVSSLQALSPAARDFFMDVMVYCEDQMGELKSVAAIQERYQKEIRPAL